MLSCVGLFAALWTVTHQAPLSMGFSRQEYWSGLPLPPPEDLPNPGIKPLSPLSPAMAGRFFTTAPPGKPWGRTGEILTRFLRGRGGNANKKGGVPPLCELLCNFGAKFPIICDVVYRPLGSHPFARQVVVQISYIGNSVGYLVRYH